MNCILPHKFSRAAIGLLFFALIAGSPARAQGVAFPEAAPKSSLIVADRYSIRLPFQVVPGGSLAGARLVVSEVGSTTVLAEMLARYVPDWGVFVANIDAEPGIYLARLTTGDKKTELAPPLRFLVPGVRREAGAWRLNGDLCVALGPAHKDSQTALVLNLARDAKVKLPRTLGEADWRLVGWPVEGAARPTTDADKWVTWRTLELPPLEKWAVSPVSAEELKSRAEAMGGVVLACELPVGTESETMQPVALAAAMKTARDTVKAAFPGVALVLCVDASKPTAAATILDGAAALFDAVVVRYPAPGTDYDLWPLKVARRIVEEQKDLDLPIFVRLDSAGTLSDLDLFTLDCMMAGATGFILPPGQRPSWVDKIDPVWPLLSGAVTWEDAPVHRDAGAPMMSALLRRGGRIPLLGRLPREGKGRPESCFMTLDSATNGAELESIKQAALGGATLYLEGVPPGADADLLAKLGDLTGTTIKPLPKPVPNVLTLTDIWLFGTLTKAHFPVSQSVTVELKKSLAAQTKAQPGVDALTVPRFSAELNDRPGGIVEYGVGKGRIIWLPHVPAPGAVGRDLFDYYAAVAGTMQAALVRVRPSDPTRVAPRVALRMSAGKSALLVLLNQRDVAVESTVITRGVSEVVLDGATGEKVPFTTRGNETSFQMTVPASGWRLVVLNGKAKDLEKERQGRKWKVSLK